MKFSIIIEKTCFYSGFFDYNSKSYILRQIASKLISELGVNPNNIYMPAVVYHCLLPE